MASTTPGGMPWEPPSPEELQRLIPQYEITALLGRGGMGAVYRGRQASLERDVAIKLLPQSVNCGADELNFAERFRQEARAMAKLAHPAIISVYDFGQTSAGQLFYVMEFIDGVDIHQYLHRRGGRLSQRDALTITIHVLDALAYAHENGIIHRDIKPANILLSSDGRVKIADFGLAKRFAGEGDAGRAPLTMSDMSVGTPDFIAPEAMVNGKTVDQRADLYAVGVMLYQMLTGEMPRGRFQLPSELCKELDPRLDDIVAKATASDPERRYASAAAIRADVKKVLSGPLRSVIGSSKSILEKVPSKGKSHLPLYLGLGEGESSSPWSFCWP